MNTTFANSNDLYKQKKRKPGTFLPKYLLSNDNSSYDFTGAHYICFSSLWN